MSQASILVVEDNPMNRRLARDVLERSGHRIHEAANLDEGRALLRSEVFDVVLLDIGVPGGGGEVLLKEIRADARLAGLPVIAVTAYAMVGDRERFLQLGFDGYLSKPINTRTFSSDVESYLRSAR